MMMLPILMCVCVCVSFFSSCSCSSFRLSYYSDRFTHETMVAIARLWNRSTCQWFISYKTSQPEQEYGFKDCAWQGSIKVNMRGSGEVHHAHFFQRQNRTCAPLDELVEESSCLFANAVREVARPVHERLDDIRVHLDNLYLDRRSRTTRNENPAY